MTLRRGDLLVCSYPSRTSKYGAWRVVVRRGQYILQWMAGASFPAKVTSETVISRETAKAHWGYAQKRYGGQIHFKAWGNLP